RGSSAPSSTCPMAGFAFRSVTLRCQSCLASPSRPPARCCASACWCGAAARCWAPASSPRRSYALASPTDGRRMSPEAALLRCGCPALDLVQFPVNAEFDAADRHQLQFGLGAARLHLAADPESPAPDSRHARRNDGELYPPVNHGTSPSDTRLGS